MSPKDPSGLNHCLSQYLFSGLVDPRSKTHTTDKRLEVRYTCEYVVSHVSDLMCGSYVLAYLRLQASVAAVYFAVMI